MLPQARKEKLTIRELADETLVYDLERHQAHCLNRSAALVWRHCDGHTNVTELADILHEELDIPADDRVVWLALDRLGRANLLQQPFTVPGHTRRHSRRELLRKLGVALVALPVVMSISTPRAAAQASLFGTCTSDADCARFNGPCTLGKCVNFFCTSVNKADGTSCGSGMVCRSGACVSSACPSGQTNCGTPTVPNCKNLQTDNANCGKCSNACASAQMCTNGACTCPSGNPCTSDAGCPGGMVCSGGCCI